MITLTKLKVAGGEETPRFEAMLSFNGREIARVSNGGTGGSCSFWWLHPHEDRSLLFSWATEQASREEPTLFGPAAHTEHYKPGGEEALDYLVLGEVELAGTMKRLQRQMKGKTLIRFWGEKESVYRSINIAYVPGGRHPGNDPRVAVCLNALSLRDAALRLRTAEPERELVQTFEHAATLRGNGP
jgi:hypothetical protein